MRMNGGRLVLGAVVALLAVGATDLAAQESEDARWQPWLGCWVEASAPNGEMLCVVPEGPGVELRTFADGEAVESRRLRADGVERQVEVAGCDGPEALEFSPDGRRVYTRAELNCNGGLERQTVGLMAVVEPELWIHVRSLRLGDEDVVWVERYRPAPSARVAAAGMEPLAERLAQRARALEMARIAASSRVGVEAVIEANARIGSGAVRAWLAEDGEPFRLDADRLVQLADAGVGPEVIDVMIAVTYPDRFAVARQQPEADGEQYGYSELGPLMSYDPYGYNYGYDRFGYSRYSPYGYYGYQRYGYWGPGYRGPTVVVVRPRDETRLQGRAVKGEGYTHTGTATGERAKPRGSVQSTGISAPSSRTTGGTAVRSTGSSSSSTSKGKAKKKGSGGE